MLGHDTQGLAFTAATARGDVVNGAGHVREKIRVAIGRGGDQGTDLDALGGLGPGPELGPRLEVCPVGFPAQREEVIPREQDVDTDLLEGRADATDLRVRRVLRLDLGGDPDLRCHGSTMSPLPMTTTPFSVMVNPRAASRAGSSPISVPSGISTFLSMIARWIRH